MHFDSDEARKTAPGHSCGTLPLIFENMLNITRIEKSILLFIIFSSLTSCDYFYSGSGIVIDRISKQPIDSVLIEAYLIDKNESLFVKQMYSDSVGRFHLSTGPLGSHDMDLVLIFSKEGYNNLIAKEPYGENIILERNNTIRNYLQPYYKRQLGIIK